MSKWTVPAILAVVGALASCQTAAPDPRSGMIDTRQAMVAGVNPAAMTIWDIAHQAGGEDGELDPAHMDEAAWSRLDAAAQTLETYSLAMAEAGTIRAAGPDLVDGRVPEGAASREEIQAMIDADPAGFRAEARELAERARRLEEAARARDFAAAGHRAAEIDPPCQSCHSRYWYKQQSQRIEERRPKG